MPPIRHQKKADEEAKKIFDVITNPGLTGPNPHRISEGIDAGANLKYIDPATGLNLLDASIIECIKTYSSPQGGKSRGYNLQRTASALLIELGARLGPAHSETTIAHMLVLCADFISLKKLTKAHRENPAPETDINRSAGEQGLTPLHLAIIRLDLKFVGALVKEDANIEVVDNKGRAPLMLFDECFKGAASDGYDAKDIARVRQLLGPDNPRVKSLQKAWDSAHTGFPMERDMDETVGVNIKPARPFKL